MKTLQLIQDRSIQIPMTASRFQEAFHITELHKQCPEVSLDMIRKVLKEMRQANEIECLGRGEHARWQRIG